MFIFIIIRFIIYWIMIHFHNLFHSKNIFLFLVSQFTRNSQAADDELQKVYDLSTLIIDKMGCVSVSVWTWVFILCPIFLRMCYWSSCLPGWDLLLTSIKWDEPHLSILQYRCKEIVCIFIEVGSIHDTECTCFNSFYYSFNQILSAVWPKDHPLEERPLTLWIWGSFNSHKWAKWVWTHLSHYNIRAEY